MASLHDLRAILARAGLSLRRSRRLRTVEKRPDDFEEGLRLLGMDPVTGFGNAYDPRLWEQTVDRRLMLRKQVVGAAAGNE